MNAHDRFESLAGAIALNEATPEERAIFVTHARTCDVCSEDALDAQSSPLAMVAVARDEERWRPALDRAVLSRIADRHQQRSRFAISALSWAAGLSIAANVVFATGFASSVSRVLLPADLEAPAASIESVGIRLPAQTFARRAPLAALALREYAPMRVFRHAHRPAARHLFAGAHVTAAAPAVVPQVEPDALADLLDANAMRGGRKVALESTRTESQPLRP